MKCVTLFMSILLVIKSSESAALPATAVIYQNLPAPVICQTKVYVDGGPLIIKWEPVEVDETNPILGYKVKLWRGDLNPNKCYSIQNIDGEERIIESSVPKSLLSNGIPNFEPEVVTVGPNVTEAVFKNIKHHVEYPFVVQAFNDKGEGPYTFVNGFEIGDITIESTSISYS